MRGYVRRLAIARTSLRSPGILIRDEATSALDSITERKVHDAVLAESEGRTVLVIAHRLATVRNADKIYYLDDGRILESGQHEELVQSGGHYRRLYDAQLVGTGTGTEENA